MPPSSPPPLWDQIVAQAQADATLTPTEARRLLMAARDVLRSYQVGNDSPDLAAEIAAEIDLALQRPDPSVNSGHRGPRRG